MFIKIFIICLLFFFTLTQAQNTKERLAQLYKDVTVSQLRGSDMEKTISEVTSILELKSLTTEDRLKGLLRSEEHTSELQSRPHLVCRLLLEKKKKKKK